MAKYKKHSYSQSLFIPVIFNEQIIPGTFEHALNYIIDNKVDLSIFDGRFKNDETGAPAYSPAILLKIILYAYSLGIIHSRKIERCCENNVTFIALSANTTPHFTTIANFISSLEKEVSDIFLKVLMVCASENLIGKNMFAIDGCKLSSNCSKEWSGTRKDLKKKKKKIEKSIRLILRKHKEKDNNRLFTEDMVEKEQKGLKKLNEKADRIQRWLDENKKDKIGTRGKPIQSNLIDNESAKMVSSHGVVQGYNGVAVADDKHQVVVSANAFGSSAESHQLMELVDHTRENFSAIGESDDIFEKSVLLADSGFHSEANVKAIYKAEIDAYIADNKFRKRDPKFKDANRYKKRTIDRKHTVKSEKKYFHSSDFTFDPQSKKLICPEGYEMLFRGYYKKKDGLKGTTYKGAKENCCTCTIRKKCLRNANTSKFRQVTLFSNKLSDTNESFTKKMIEKFDSAKGRHLYSRRMGLIEPVFANIRNMIGTDKFTLRGKKKVNTQWKLYCIVHNIGKIARYSNLAVC